LIHIGGRSYELVEDHKNGWNPVAFRDRYSDVLDRYDYVIGDWGYNQLRLKGFFRDNHPKATPGSVISGIVDYINEYCNFGCAYFVLHKHPGGRKEAAEDDIDLDTLVVPVRTEGDEDNPELEAAPVAAGLAADGEELPPPREHIRAVPRHTQRRTPPPRKGSNGQREGEEGQAASSNGSSNNRKSQGTAAVSGKEKSEHREGRDKDRNKEGARQRNPQGGVNASSNGAAQDKQERQQERKQGQGQQHEQQPKRKQDRQQGQQQERKLERQSESAQPQERKQGKVQGNHIHLPIEKAPVAAAVEDAGPVRTQEANIPVSSDEDRTQ